MYACTTSRPKCSTMRRSSCTPFALAAIIARRSAMFCSMLRAGYLPDARSAIMHCSRPADAGTGAPRADVEQDILPRVVEHWCHHGDVGQMGAAVVGRVEHIDIA